MNYGNDGYACYIMYEWGMNEDTWLSRLWVLVGIESWMIYVWMPCLGCLMRTLILMNVVGHWCSKFYKFRCKFKVLWLRFNLGKNKSIGKLSIKCLSFPIRPVIGLDGSVARTLTIVNCKSCSKEIRPVKDSLMKHKKDRHPFPNKNKNPTRPKHTSAFQHNYC